MQKQLLALLFFIIFHSVPSIADFNLKASNQLLKTTKYGHLDEVKALITQGADINFTKRRKNTPLINAAAHGKLDILQYLIENGANLYQQNSKHEDAMSFAAKKRQEESIQILLENGFDVNRYGDKGWFYLYKSSKSGCYECVKYLMALKIPIENISNKKSALITAIRSRKANIVNFLLEQGADANFITQSGDSPLFIAVDKNNKTSVKYLIKYGAKIEQTNPQGYTPLHWAAVKGADTIAKLLIKHQANIESSLSNDTTALFSAAHHGKHRMVSLLLNHGASKHVVHAKSGNSALMQAANRDYKKVIKKLIEFGVNVDQQNNNGLTALHFAAKKGKRKTVELLLENKANPNILSNDNLTALMVATRNRHFITAKALKKAGAQTNEEFNKNIIYLDKENYFPPRILDKCQIMLMVGQFHKVCSYSKPDKNKRYFEVTLEKNIAKTNNYNFVDQFSLYLQPGEYFHYHALTIYRLSRKDYLFSVLAVKGTPNFYSHKRRLLYVYNVDTQKFTFQWEDTPCEKQICKIYNVQIRGNSKKRRIIINQGASYKEIKSQTLHWKKGKILKLK